MTERTGDKKSKFWQFIHNIHFYKSKGEGLFKTIAIVISWCGGVNILHFSSTTILDNNIAASFFLFSTALMMEYVVQLIYEKQFIKKIVPLLMVIPSILVFIVSCSALLQRPLEVVPLKVTYACTYFPVIVIGIDVFLQLTVENTEIQNLETGLKDIKVEIENG